jgi:hypothetical protein
MTMPKVLLLDNYATVLFCWLNGRLVEIVLRDVSVIGLWPKMVSMGFVVMSSKWRVAI